MNTSTRPPRLARALAHVCLRGETREIVVGDLDQDFADQLAATVPVSVARRRYWRQTLASIASVHRPHRTSPPKITSLWHGLSLDVRAVVRTLRRSPGYTVVAVLSLAIGIGANTAIVSVVRQVLLQQLPVERPGELKLVYWQPPLKERISTQNTNATGYTSPDGIQYRSNYTYPEFAAMTAAISGDVPFAGYNNLRQVTVATGMGAPLSTSGLIVTGDFFNVVRPPLALGRGLSTDDDRPGVPMVAVISYRLWTSHLGSATDVLGRTLTIGDTPATIIGVTADGYRGLSPAGFLPDVDVTVPMAAQTLVAPEWTEPGTSLLTDTDVHWIRAIARVPAAREAEVSTKLVAAFRAAASATTLTPSQIAASAPVLLPAPRGVDSLRGSTLAPLRLLSVVVGIVLLIACTNVAGLMLARGVSRQRELAVRRALGASRLRVVRELLVESLLLSLTGGAAGILLAVLSAPALQAMLTSGIGTSDVTVTLDWATLVTTLVIAVGTGVLAGLIPALRLSGRQDVSINDRGQVAPRLRVGRALLAIQIAVSLPLVAGAGLCLRTLHNLGRIELGFDPSQLVLFDVDPTMNGRTSERAAVVYPALMDRLEGIPGVASATYLENPLIGGWQSNTNVKAPDGTEVDLMINRVGPHYFETLGVRLLAGRSIEARDHARTALVGLLNESAARRLFGDVSPIGQNLKINSRSFEIVGVFADTRYDSLKKAVQPTMLMAYLQNAMFGHTIVVRTSLAPAALRAQLPAVLHDVDPTLPFSKFQTQVDVINDSIGRERIFSQLLTVFGAFALLLACIGLHGVTSYAVARRTSEIGLRLALGARRAQVLWMILRQVIVLAAVGLAIGLPAAVLTGVALRPYLFELTAGDPLTIAGSAVVIIAVATAAGWLPARRAARMEALAALRIE